MGCWSYSSNHSLSDLRRWSVPENRSVGGSIPPLAPFHPAIRCIHSQKTSDFRHFFLGILQANAIQCIPIPRIGGDPIIPGYGDAIVALTATYLARPEAEVVALRAA